MKIFVSFTLFSLNLLRFLERNQLRTGIKIDSENSCILFKPKDKLENARLKL